MELAAFKATRRACADIEEELGFDLGGLPGGFIYADSAYICDHEAQADEGKRYYLNVWHDEWLSDDLEKLERILWAEYWLTECGRDSAFRLDQFNFHQLVLGMADARNIAEVDLDQLADRLFAKGESDPLAAYQQIADNFRPIMERRYRKAQASVEMVCAGAFSA